MIWDILATALGVVAALGAWWLGGLLLDLWDWLGG